MGISCFTEREGGRKSPLSSCRLPLCARPPDGRTMLSAPCGCCFPGKPFPLGSRALRVPAAFRMRAVSGKPESAPRCQNAERCYPVSGGKPRRIRPARRGRRSPRRRAAAGIKNSRFLHKSVQNSANFLLSMEVPQGRKRNGPRGPERRNRDVRKGWMGWMPLWWR